MANSPDVLIIGGGIIGLTTAYLAANAGLKVEVYDRGDLGREASWAGAGILPPGNLKFAATPLDRLRAIGSEQMPKFSAELHERTGVENGYLRCGGIEFLQPTDRYALELWDAEHIRYEPIARGDVAKFEPHLAEPPGDAYLLPDCAQVRNPRHLRALAAACEAVGVKLVTHMPATGWILDGTRVIGVGLADGTSRHASRFLLAAGAWSEGLLSALGHSPGMHPVLGQIVLFKTSSPVLTRVLMLGKEYLVPRADGHVLVGSTEEPEAGFTKRTTAAGVGRLHQLAVKLVPLLGKADMEKCWAGLRPGTRDEQPYLGLVPGTENVLIAAGHFRAGVQLSLGTAQVMTDLLTGQSPRVPIEDFRLDRPSLPSKPSAFRS